MVWEKHRITLYGVACYGIGTVGCTQCGVAWFRCGMVLYGTGRYGMEVVNSRAGRRESGAEQGGAGGGGGVGTPVPSTKIKGSVGVGNLPVENRSKTSCQLVCAYIYVSRRGDRKRER